MPDDFKGEDELAFDYADPDNILLLDIFNLAFDQLIIGPSGPIALNLQVMPLLFDAHGVTHAFDKRWLLTDLKSLAAGFIEGNREK